MTGKVVGKKVAQVQPGPAAKVIIEPQGGAFCPVLTAMGAPFEIVPTDSRTSREPLLNIDEHYDANCPKEPTP